MPTAVWTGITASALYLIATLIAARQLHGARDSQRGAFLGLGALALLFHICALWQLTVQDAGLYLGLFPIASIIAATGVAVVCVSGTYRPLEWTSIMVFPFAAITIPAALWIHTGMAARPLEHGIGAHVLLSISAYAVLALAACQAVLVLIQHRQLKRGHIRGIIGALPPLQVMERMQFELLWTGMVLLTLAVLSGFLYLDDLFAQHLVHKTFFTLASWCVFATLLGGRYLVGWRGITAVKFILIGFAILLVGFFGSQFVFEIILRQP